MSNLAVIWGCIALMREIVKNQDALSQDANPESSINDILFST